MKKSKNKKRKLRWWYFPILFIMLITGLSFISRNFFAGIIDQQKLNHSFSNTPFLAPKLKNINSAGHPLRYIVAGNSEGPTILFIHGAPGSLEAYINFFKDSTLLQQARLISVDRPGYGGSGFGIPMPSLEDQSQLIKAVLDNENAQDVIIVGHSLGGPIAVKMAIDYPEITKALLLMAPSIDPNLEEWKWYQAFALSKIGRILTPTAMVVAADEIYYLREQLEELRPFYYKIKAFTILMQGEKDRLVDKGNAYFAEQMMTDKNYEIQLLPNEDHFIPWTQPQLVIQNLKTLINLKRPHASVKKHKEVLQFKYLK